MRILIVNDDGITAKGIRVLANAAIQAGHDVTIVAPSSQCSAYGQHLTLMTPLFTSPVPWQGAKAFSVDGTPADCARIGEKLAGHPFDVCLSGINHGENAGPGIFYSGTVAAAREAAMMYLPSIAVSACAGASDETLAFTAQTALAVAEKIKGKDMPRAAIVNINAPALPPDQIKPMRLCPASDCYFIDNYERRVSPFGRVYFWVAPTGDEALPLEPSPESSDIALLRDGHMTCTLVGGLCDQNAFLQENMQEFGF